MKDLTKDEINRLYEMYQMYCSTHEQKSTVRGFIDWYVENYDFDLYMEWIDGEPYIDSKRINDLEPSNGPVLDKPF